MIAGATRGTGGDALSRHLLKRQNGQEVVVMPARGLAADSLKGQIRELVASAAHGRTSRPVHHVHIDPPPDCVDLAAVIESFLKHYEREFGLENAQRAGVYHTKNGRRHAHVVWSLVGGDGSVVSLAHDHARREKVSRIVEFEHGLPMTKGKHNRSAAKALRAEGREDVADAMEAAGLLSGRRPVAHSTPRQRAQAERTAVPINEIRNQTYAAWQASDDAKSFAVMLHAFDSVVAQGDRGLVLVDRAAGTHSLNRVIAAAARAAGAEKITAAMVRKRIGGIIFPPVKEVQNAQRNRRNLERHDSDENEHRKAAPASEPSQGAERRGAPDRRIESVASSDRGNPETPERSLAQARKRLRDTAAVEQLKNLDLQAVNQTKGEIMKQIKAQNFKAKILAEIAPEGFNAHAFSLDLRMIQKPTPGRPNARIMTTDGGWIEIDSGNHIVRTWGATGRAQALAQALADAIGCETTYLTKTASVSTDAASLRVVKLTENKIKSLVKWWGARGYIASPAPDGCWINAGRARILDRGNEMEIHGGVTDEAIAATILKAKESWHGGLYLDGHWTQDEQDRMWIAAQRNGIDIENCNPTKVIQEAWRQEQDAAARSVRTISAARSAVAVAADVKAAAGGDLDALERLPKPLQAFVVSHLDDGQRKHLAAQGVAFIIPELQRFRQIGDGELAEFKRQGKRFSPALPRRPDQAPNGFDLR